MYRLTDPESASSVTEKPAANSVHQPVAEFSEDGEKQYTGQDDGRAASHLAIHHEISDPAASSQKLRGHHKHPCQTQSAAKSDDVLRQHGRKNESPNHLETTQPV